MTLTESISRRVFSAIQQQWTLLWRSLLSRNRRGDEATGADILLSISGIERAIFAY